MKKTTAPPPVEKNRYSDEELEEFRLIILSKLEKAQSDLKMLIEAQRPHGENGTDDTFRTFKTVEHAYQTFTIEENAKFAARQEKFIKSLQNALIRIENRTYGICRKTGKLIPKDRLLSVPHATLTIEEKRIQVVHPMPGGLYGGKIIDPDLE